MSCLGIIAGSGALPRKLIDACEERRQPYFVLGFRGQTDTSLMQGIPHAWTRLGATGEAIQILKKQNVERLVMAGAIRRPSLAEMRPDWRTIQIFTRLGRRAFGDDALLRAVADELRRENFTVIGAHEISPDLLTPEGVLGKMSPSDDALKDIHFGIEVTRELGRLDVGQAAVIQAGLALGLEAAEGTDALLERCEKLAKKGTGGVLVKSCKPQQDKRLDLPTIGLRTIRKAYQAGLTGIAAEAGASLLLEREEVIEAADKLGLFLVGFKA